MTRLMACSLAMSLLGCAVAQQPAASKPSERATPPAAAGETRTPFDSSDQLLDALERATEGLRDFQAAVVYDRTDAITGDRERRTGRIALEQPVGDGTRRRFGIAFDQFIDAAGHASPQVQRFAFGDGWLVEFDDAPDLGSYDPGDDVYVQSTGVGSPAA